MRIFEINTRVHCQKFNRISNTELKTLNKLGFDAIWLMGVWGISPGVLSLSKLISEDFEGSPYAIPDYEFSRALGGRRQFAEMARRAQAQGLKVIVDFVSNHLALDSPWIYENPEFFIRGNLAMRKQVITDFFLHGSGEVVAFGRDPYFPPWNDTAQLDYTSAALRDRMTKTLEKISRVADGVRCDMAMLVLRDCIRHQWFPLAPLEWFNNRMPGEFWDEAITRVKKRNPDFCFIAEAYWDKERYLCELGFDLAYEKKLYDALIARNAAAVTERLSQPLDRLRQSLYFIENHDEPRAASVFAHASNLASAALILSIPGSVLIHEGQMEGKREKLPVQRIKPLTDEPPDVSLKEAYTHLLRLTSDEPFKSGSFRLFDAGTYGVVAFIRQTKRRAVAYLGQISEAWHKFNQAPMDLSALARELGMPARMRVRNLFNEATMTLSHKGDLFRAQLSGLGVDEETTFCLLEAEAV